MNLSYAQEVSEYYRAVLKNRPLICIESDEYQTARIMLALNAAGYLDAPPTIENLIECFLDYADSHGLDTDDLREQIADGDITVDDMCRALICG